jgi:hypothetical protein
MLLTVSLPLLLRSPNLLLPLLLLLVASPG